MKTTITQIRDLITAPPTGSRHEARANYERIAELQHRAAVIYGEKRGWTLSDRPFSLRALHEGRIMRGCDYNAIPHMDHAFFYLDDRRRPAGIIVHLYHVPNDIHEWAHERGLRVSFPKVKSWWNPGRTKLAVYTSAEVSQ